MRIGKGGILLMVVAISCQPQNDPSINEDYVFKVPEFFPEPTYTFDNNPVTEAGFELGRKLFFDPLLSRDNTVACSSCHSQSVAFADPQHRLSLGIEDRIGKRNAPSISNLAFLNHFFWDGGVIHVDFIPVNAIENELEMDNDLSTILERLRVHEKYPEMFAKAFGEDTINSGRMLHALAQFLVMMVSANSGYDQYLRKEGTLTGQELEGLVLFEEKCSSCHEGILFTNNGFENNGLDSIFTIDQGRAIITEVSEDVGKFRVPSLRNVALTAPYMHNGQFKTLQEILDHYANGVVKSPTLSPILQSDTLTGIPISKDDKSKIIAFLNTLTDHDFISDRRFFGSR